MKNIVVLISGNGSNLQAIIDACKQKKINGTIRAVFSNKADAFGLERAREANIPAHALEASQFAGREAFDRELVQVVADGGELPHHVVEPVVRLFLRLKAAHQKAEQRRLGQAGALGFLLQLLRFVTGEPKLLFDRPLHLSSPSLLLV